MKKVLVGLVGIVGIIFAIDFNSSSSKYDTNISKYEVGSQTFRYKFEENTNRCEEVALKEREAILADIKSGRFKMRTHPDYKDAILLSNDFSREKEFLYFSSINTCLKYNKNLIINNIRVGY